MSQQYRKINMAEVQRVLDAMEPDKIYDAGCLATAIGMPRQRIVFVLLKAENKGLVEVKRPGFYRARKEMNRYRKVAKK